MSTLTLPEVATLLGKSERQVRYLIKQGRLQARKDGRRWLVESTELPLSESQRQALGERVRVARDAFERGVAPADKASRAKRRYTVRELDTFRIGVALLRDLRGALGLDHPAPEALMGCLRDLTVGCHEYHPEDKVHFFVCARRQAAVALVELLAGAEDGSSEPREALAERLEQELLPKLAGMIAGQERRRAK
jgi:excisionase family DNA binding protein